MNKKYFIILLVVTVVIAISGCTTKTATNGTFGEKSISINSIFLSNNTTSDIYQYNGTQYYYIKGYLVNNNSNDVFNVKVTVVAYDSNSNIVATNDSTYLKPSSIPAKGIAEFYADFPDPNNNIVRYDVKIVNATGIL